MSMPFGSPTIAATRSGLPGTPARWLLAGVLSISLIGSNMPSSLYRAISQSAPSTLRAGSTG